VSQPPTGQVTAGAIVAPMSTQYCVSKHPWLAGHCGVAAGPVELYVHVETGGAWA
jgi:hypothetical protein